MSPELSVRTVPNQEIKATNLIPTPVPVEKNIQPESFFGLTDRQLTILHSVSRGDSNNDIAGAMHLEYSSVKNHTNRIFKKMGIPNDPDIDRKVKAVLLYKERFSVAKETSDKHISKLSHREMEVYALVAKAYSNRRIAQTIGVADRTVNTHFYNICSKLSINTEDRRVKAVLMFDKVKDANAAEAEKSFFGLTERQLEVLSLMSQGLSNGEIADAIVVEMKTVECHIGGIFKKMSISNDPNIDPRIKAVSIFWDKFPPQDSGLLPDIQKLLSPRQMEVLSLIAQGYSNSKIAKRFSLSDRTVEQHITAIFSNLPILSGGRRVQAAFLFRLSQQKESRQVMVQEIVGLLAKKLKGSEIGG